LKAATSYHLDTSAQVERWFGSGASQARFAKVLDTEGEHTSSTHVRREWKRIVDQSAVEMLNTLTSEDPYDDLPRLAQGYGREPNRRMLVLISLMRQAKGQDWSRDELRLRASQLLDFRSAELFESGLSEVRDGSECGLADCDAAPGGGGHYAIKVTCQKTEQICRQPDDIESKLEHWTAAAQSLKEAKPYESMGKTALKMASDSANRKGVNCYARTGDISVALECGEDETILTTDASFETIGPAIGRDVERLPATERPPKGKAKTR
jgi:hypothetical protein